MVTWTPSRAVWYCARFWDAAVKGARYIVVEGPIGVGKTTLARLLADALGARVVLEQVDENPFLKRFYDRPRQYAFQTQLFFLLTRYRQQKELAQQDLFGQNTVVDYLFAKDQIFAQLNLDTDELALYRQLFGLLDARLAKPDLVVYLQARVDVLLDRLRRRDREYERRISPEYIHGVAEAYRDFFFYYDETPLLVINSSEIDFVANSDQMADLIREIKGMGQGVQHYIPLGSK
jgi:deoxyguanosine kinase